MSAKMLALRQLLLTPATQVSWPTLSLRKFWIAITLMTCYGTAIPGCQRPPTPRKGVFHEDPYCDSLFGIDRTGLFSIVFRPSRGVAKLSRDGSESRSPS